VKVPFFGFLLLIYRLDLRSSAILVFELFISLIAVLEFMYFDHCFGGALLEITSRRAFGNLLSVGLCRFLQSGDGSGLRVKIFWTGSGQPSLV